ncbi:hypothetical protein SASPL_125674 [Salvia splendens]|uniref:Cytochrome P450 n=1 Tax=Salvia splendens TaxID=180675 RepID=A0A8X8ZQY7_SALSN|nr:hypothetical protein SASPL_125674 [Salvia splendens]
MDCVLIAVVMGVMLLGLRWFVFLLGPRKRLPPGPRPLPIIGNMHQLGKNQTETLRQLAKTYGPLMSIRIGSVYTVVASTPEMAMELLQHHGQVFSGRTEMLQKLVDHVGGHCDRGDVVNIHDVVFMANLNLLLTTIFSITSPDTAMELMKIMEDFFSLFAPNITDYFPILKVLDPQGMKRKAELSLGKLLKKFRDFLNHRLDHRMNNPKNKKQDLLEAIIDTTQGNDYNITTQDIPYLLFAVIRETFRYHPPRPLMFTRMSEADQEVNGYMIPKGTQIVVNTWSMAKDPSIWTDPESFEPERFLDNKLDFKGQHFQLIPFGRAGEYAPEYPWQPGFCR